MDSVHETPAFCGQAHRKPDNFHENRHFMDNIQKYMKIKEGFVLRQMCGENIVAGEGLQHVNFNKLISLNESAAYLWNELQGKEFTQAEMAELLIKRYGIDEQLAMIDSEKLMASWSEIGLTE